MDVKLQKKCQESCQRTIKKFYFPKQTAVPRTDFQYATYLIRKITEREEVKVFFPLTTKWTFKSLIWNTYRRKYWKSKVRHSRPRNSTKYTYYHTKGGFFSESAIHFSNLQISKSPKKNIPKNYPELEI